MTDAVVTAGIAAAGVIVGWFVIGTQRVTEELTSQRRAAYAAVLEQADRAADLGGSTAELRRAVRAAEFLASERMYAAQRLPALLVDVGSDEWHRQVAWFRAVARRESHRNSSLRRWWDRRRYTDPSFLSRS